MRVMTFGSTLLVVDQPNQGASKEAGAWAANEQATRGWQQGRGLPIAQDP